MPEIFVETKVCCKVKKTFDFVINSLNKAILIIFFVFPIPENISKVKKYAVISKV